MKRLNYTELMNELNKSVEEDRSMNDEAIAGAIDLFMRATVLSSTQTIKLDGNTAHLVAKALVDLAAKAGIRREQT